MKRLQMLMQEAKPDDPLDTRQVDHEKLLASLRRELMPVLQELVFSVRDLEYRQQRHKPFRQASARQRKAAQALASWLGDTNSCREIVSE